MDLETRVNRLETENRVLKCGGLLLVAVVLFTAFMPQGQVQDVVRARRIELVHADGRLGAVLRLLGVDVGIGAGAALEIFQFDAGGAVAVALTGDLDGGSLLMRTGLRQGLGNEGETYVRLEGPNGIAVLGNTNTVDQGTGATTSFPVSTLTLFDGEGNVRYQIPR